METVLRKENTMKKYHTHIIVVLPWVIALFFWWRLPETIALHIDLFGRFGNYMDTRWVILIMGVQMLLAHFVLLYIVARFPKQFGINAKKAKMYQWTMPISSLFLMWCLVGKYLF